MKKILSILTICVVFMLSISVNAATTVVNVSKVAELQSAHNYTDNLDKMWVYTHSEEADSLTVKFSSDTAVENNYDKIYIYDGEDTLIGTYTGTALANQSITVTGNIIKIKLTSDGSVNKYGFRVTSIDAVISGGPISDLYATLITQNAITMSFSAATDATKVTLEQSTDGVNYTEIQVLTNTDTSATVTYHNIIDNKYYFRLNITGGKREGISNVVTASYNEYVESMYEFSNGTITKYIGDESIVVIPSKIHDLDVRIIADEAFKGRTELTEITIPEGIESIGAKAFNGCTNLTTVNFNAINCTNIGGRYVGDDAFGECNAITKINIGEQVTSIPDSAFSKLTGITSITFPDSVTSIGWMAFKNCKGLTEVNFPETLLRIEDYAFEGCSKLTEITIPESVEYVTRMAFYGCTGIEKIYFNAKKSAGYGYTGHRYSLGVEDGFEVIIGDTVEEIPEYFMLDSTNLKIVRIGKNIKSISRSAFSGCTSLSIVDIPDSVTSICDSAFYNCDNLENINFPENLETIGNYSFDNAGLKKVFFPKKLQEIGVCAFEGNGLKNITMPQSIRTIGNRAFSYNYYVACVYEGTQEQWENVISDGSDFTPFYFECTSSPTENGFIIVNKSNYLVSYTGDDTSIELNNIKGINEGVFAGKENLERIYISDSIEMIGAEAFLNTKYYTNESNWENGMLYIGNWLIDVKEDYTGPCNIKEGTIGVAGEAFFNCTKLTMVSFPDTLKYISADAFEGCSSLRAFFVSDLKNWLEINPETNIFYGNEAVLYAGNNIISGEVTIPAEITKIPNWAFCGNDNITKITIPETVTEIGVYAFSECAGITNIIIPNSVTVIGEGAFKNCNNIESIKLSDNLTAISSYMFHNCSKLIEISMSNKIESIEQYAFANCSLLPSVSLCDNVHSIGSYAFYNCDNIERIIIPNGISVIENNTFQSCGKLTDVTIPDSVTIIDSYAFRNCPIVNLMIPNSVTTIKDNAFYYCDDLESVTISNTMENIEYNAFYGCNTLKTVNFIGTTMDWLSVAIDTSNTPLLNATVNYITPVVVSGISLNTTNISIGKGETMSLIANVLPIDATNKKVNWLSSDESIATVSNGVVVGIKEGVTTITATTVDGAYSASCTVTVVLKPEIITFTVHKNETTALVKLGASNIHSESKIYVATYTRNGKMLEVKTLDLIDGAAEETFLLKDVDKFKAFIWNDTMEPLCNSKEVDI